MAYFAQLNSLNNVDQIISINNSVLREPEISFPQTELLGQMFISDVLKLPGVWKQTSFNKSFRKNFAGVGYSYDKDRDAFIPPKPYNSWILNEYSCNWDSPVPYPNDGNSYSWDEQNQTWKPI